MVQWLRLGTPSAGGLGLIPGQETRSRMPQLKSCRPDFPGGAVVKNPPVTAGATGSILVWEDSTCLKCFSICAAEMSTPLARNVELPWWLSAKESAYSEEAQAIRV